jgi:RNA 2',3'-cyclic 3'-phosphodiesterase
VHDKDDQIRTFVALELPASVQLFLGRISSELKKAGGDVKWVTPNNIHLTLKFVGNTGLETIPLIQSSLENIFLGQEPLDLEVKSLGVFPGFRRPRVVWAGIHNKQKMLEQLAKKVDLSLALLGFEPEQRAFNGHLTLGRVRSNDGLQPLVEAIRRLESISGPTFLADHVVLFQSILKPSGAEYLPLFRFDLCESDDRPGCKK